MQNDDPTRQVVPYTGGPPHNEGSTTPDKDVTPLQGRVLVPDHELRQMVQDQLMQLCDGTNRFTAYGVTLKLRAFYPNQEIEHERVRDLVHSLASYNAYEVIGQATYPTGSAALFGPSYPLPAGSQVSANLLAPPTNPINMQPEPSVPSPQKQSKELLPGIDTV